MTGRRRPRLGALVAVLLATAALGAGRPVTVAAAGGIGAVQHGGMTAASGPMVTASLPAGSSAGTLLVATVYGATTTLASGPAGWIQGPGQVVGGVSAEIWYYPANPGGITGAAFTTGSATLSLAQLSEWSGVSTSAPVDQTGSAGAALATGLTVTGSATASGDLAITAFAEGAGAAASFTPGAGWSALGSQGGGGAVQGAGDERLGPPPGPLSETEGSSVSGAWAGVMVTFRPAPPPCSGGSLGLTVPGAVTFGGVLLDGHDQTSSAPGVVLLASDMTGSGGGWNVTATSTLLSDGGGHTLPASATTLTHATASAQPGMCALPVSGVSYATPLVLPAAAVAPSPIKIFDARPGSGTGPVAIDLGVQLTLPADTYAGAYASTWTLTISSGP